LLSRIPPVRRSAPLVAAVFVVGAGVGAAVAALSHSPAARDAQVKRLALPQGHSDANGDRAGLGGSPARRQAPRPQHAGAPELLLPGNAQASFEALASRLGGQAGLAVGPIGAGEIETFGSLQAGHAWSTMKVPVLVTLLDDLRSSGQQLSGQEERDATLALEESDNAAAEALFGELERIHGGLVGASDALQRTLEGVGDQTSVNTQPNNQGFTTWGQTIWSASEEVRFYGQLAAGCLLPVTQSEFVLGLMQKVIPSQRWGAGAAGYPPSVSLGFKGGWGPENGAGYLVRQTAIVSSGQGGYVVSMIALPASGSFESGTSMISALARWARGHLSLHAYPGPPRCEGGR
jgi:hypothetical protein